VLFEWKHIANNLSHLKPGGLPSKQTASQNWVRLFRAYKKVNRFELGDLKVNSLNLKLKNVQSNQRQLKLYCKWSLLARKYLKRHNQIINRRWIRLVNALAMKRVGSITLKNFLHFDNRTIVKLMKQE